MLTHNDSGAIQLPFGVPKFHARRHDSDKGIVDTIEVMRLQEDNIYVVHDFLGYQDDTLQEELDYLLNSMDTNDDNDNNDHDGQHLTQQQIQSSSNNNNINCDTIDVDCRTKMSTWCYQVVDFCKLSRETVSIAMSYLDRYTCVDDVRHNTDILTNRKTYQLAAMTCLYTAVKVFEPEAIDPKLISGLSRGIYSEKQITTMEQSILKALQWRMNPPTPLSFARYYLMLIDLMSRNVDCKGNDSIENTESNCSFTIAPSATAALALMSEETKLALYQLTKYQIELAISEYDLITCNASSIAFAAFVNAIMSIEDGILPKHIKDYFIDGICKLLSIERCSKQTQSIQQALHHIISMNNNNSILAPTSPITAPKAIVNNSDIDSKCILPHYESPRCAATV